MKTKLLKKLRARGYYKIDVYSITKTFGSITGMRYGHNGDYGGLFEYGDTEEDVRKKASRRYLELNIDWIRKRYKKYSRKYKKS